MGVGIIRISGPDAKVLAEKMIHQVPQARQAIYTPFYGENGDVVDEGIALFFQAPNSFTGEDVLELQGHGGQVVMDVLLQAVLDYGVRMARPGEFSERAFLNDKLDLAQAEAVADLIDASSIQAARSAVRSLQGVFSQKINKLVDYLVHLRMYVEAAIDFPEEEVDFLADREITAQLDVIQKSLVLIQEQAKQGAILKEGMTIVIAGKPNAGKSSLLNALAGRESAIVTDIAGTTRDVLREHIQIKGIPLHIIDTAGLRETQDIIEQEGVKRARDMMQQADQILLVVDQADEKDLTVIYKQWLEDLPTNIPVTVIINKIDMVASSRAEQDRVERSPDFSQDHTVIIRLSAKTSDGLNLLRDHLLASIGFNATIESGFIARRRHLDAIVRASEHVAQGAEQLQQHRAGELLAEDLRQAQEALSEITGEFTSDDLLGKIFSSFCIGK